MTADAWSGNARRRRALVGLVLANKGRTCHLCGQPGATSADHIVPRSKGGEVWSLDNLAPSHYSCNSARGNRSLAEWFAAKPLLRSALTPSRDW